MSTEQLIELLRELMAQTREVKAELIRRNALPVTLDEVP